MVAVRAIAERSRPFGRLLRPNGGVDRDTVSSIFDQFDEDGDGQVMNDQPSHLVKLYMSSNLGLVILP